MPLEKKPKLRRSFYNRSTLEVARDLICKQIVYLSPEGRLSARIVEVEAYIGQDDPACHATRGLTKRNEVMFGKPGVSYIYFIYGMYYCFNIVTERTGFPAAVLLRAAEPDEGIEIMQANSPRKRPIDLLNGPGKFCRSFGLTTAHSGIDLTGRKLFLEDWSRSPGEVIATPRVGIKHGIEHKWRFYDAASKAVSGTVA